MNAPAPSPHSAYDQLVARVRHDRDALGALYDNLYPTVFRFCIRRLNNRSRAEDVASTVFVNAAARLQTFSGQTYEHFRRWIFGIANNEANAELRNTSRRKFLLENAVRSGAIRTADSTEDKSVADSEKLQHAIMRLGERDQAIITMRFFGELPYPDIGHILGLTPGAVRTAVSRAVDKIKNEITPQ